MRACSYCDYFVPASVLNIYEARFEKLQAEQDLRQAEQDLLNKKVIDQVLFPLYRRHLLVCAQEKVNQLTGNKHPSRPHRESVAAPSWALGVLQPGVVITAADLNIVFANDKGSLRGGRPRNGARHNC